MTVKLVEVFKKYVTNSNIYDCPKMKKLHCIHVEGSGSGVCIQDYIRASGVNASYVEENLP